MLNSISAEKSVFGIATLLFSWIANPLTTTAQVTTPALVVVVDAGDAECVKRIGREHVRVELLLPVSPEEEAQSYEACDTQVRRILGFRLLLDRNTPGCPSTCFWRDRAVAANPHGNVQQLSRPRGGVADGFVCRVQKATDIHAALTTIFPEQRSRFDANLQVELRRLRSGQQPQETRFAFRD